MVKIARYCQGKGVKTLQEYQSYWVMARPVCYSGHRDKSAEKSTLLSKFFPGILLITICKCAALPPSWSSSHCESFLSGCPMDELKKQPISCGFLFWTAKRPFSYIQPTPKRVLINSTISILCFTSSMAVLVVPIWRFLLYLLIL